MRRLLVASTALLTLLAGCSSTEPSTTADDTPDATPTSGLLAEHGLAGKDATEIIDELDRLAVAERPTDLMASVRVDELLVSEASSGEEVALELPEDRFYLSLAPYVDSTHECFYHSLTTCKGELAGEDVQVTVTTDDGEVLVEQTSTTFDNGFLGVWLPRDVEGTVEVVHDGRRGAVPFGTGDDDPTCLTTLQLA